jgi:hypothetical protein
VQRGSRSLSHADGPLWAALLKTVRCDDAVVAPSSSSLLLLLELRIQPRTLITLVLITFVIGPLVPG